MKDIIVIFMLLVFAGVAIGKEVTIDISLTPPTEYDNGDELKLEDISTFDFYYTLDSDDIPNVNTWEPILRTEYNRNNKYSFKLNLAPRSEPYDVKVFARTTDSNGISSDLSNGVSQRFNIVESSKPKPIVDLNFNVVCDPDCIITIIE